MTHHKREIEMPKLKMLKIIGLKLQPTNSRKRKLREVERKRGKVPLCQYFQPQTSEL